MVTKDIVDLVSELQCLLGDAAPESEIEATRAELDARLGDAHRVYLLRSECDFRRGELCDFAVLHVPGPDGPSALSPPTVRNASAVFGVDHGVGRLYLIKNRYGTTGPCLQDSIPWSAGLAFSLVPRVG